MSSLKKQFQKELKTNPKKAAILGLLALVAIYFWAPLAMKMVSGGKKSSKTSKVVQQSESHPAETSAPIDSPTLEKHSTAHLPASSPAFSWDQVLEWMTKDPLTASCPELKNEHDPFKRVEKVIDVPTTENPLASESGEQAPAVVRDLSPQALGMKLTSTIVGNDRSVAMIDDRAYALGQRVIGYDGATPLPFRLVEIRPELVILERDEQQYALKINQTIGLTVEDSEGL